MCKTGLLCVAMHVPDWMPFEVNEEGQLKDGDDPPPRRGRVNGGITVRPNARHVDRGGQV